MSIDVMSAVFKLDVPQSQKLVLLAFADHANDDGFCYPSLARIAWKCGYKQRKSVREVVRTLIESGILVVVEKAHGQTPTRFQVRPHMGTQLPPFDPEDYQDRGSKKTPQEKEGGSNELNGEGISDDEISRGVETAPQTSGESAPACEHPVDETSVEGRLPGVEGPFHGRRGVVASAPESSNHHKNLKTRARTGEGPGAPRAQDENKNQNEDARLFLLNNTARNLGVTLKMPTETLEQFDRRLSNETLNRNQEILKQRAGGG